MTIKFVCPHCKTQLKATDEIAGKQGHCPKCRETIAIPKESQ